MSVGPVGPGGGKYSIIEDVAFKEYFKKKQSRGQTILDICSFAYVCGPCRARRWYIFNYGRCCVQSIFKKKTGLAARQSWNKFKYRGCCITRLFQKTDLEAKQSVQFCICPTNQFTCQFFLKKLRSDSCPLQNCKILQLSTDDELLLNCD